MNSDVLKGKWKEMKGKVKEQWGKLTDDDLDKIEGRSDQMIGLLQQRYGYAREKAEEEYDRFTSTFASHAWSPRAAEHASLGEADETTSAWSSGAFGRLEVGVDLQPFYISRLPVVVYRLHDDTEAVSERARTERISAGGARADEELTRVGPAHRAANISAGSGSLSPSPASWARSRSPSGSWVRTWWCFGTGAGEWGCSSDTARTGAPRSNSA